VPIVISDMILSEPAGIWTLVRPRFRSIFKACDTMNVPCCAMEMKLMIHDVHIGTTFTRHFTSSTCRMMQCFHGFVQEPSCFTSLSAPIKAALFKNLRKQII
jgi:hypothetical protein